MKRTDKAIDTILNFYNWSINIDKEIEHNIPSACMTLDLETDYATGKFHGSTGIIRLCDFCQSAGIPLTVFVEGRIIRDYREVLSLFPPPTEFELHCNDHRYIPDTPESLASGIKSFSSAFQRSPRGYRAACYKTTDELMMALVNHGFAWDSSCLPNFGGVFSFRKTPSNRPFRLSNGLVELPIAVLPGLGLPLTMSFISLLGLQSIKVFIMTLGLPCLMVFVIHLHDLFPSPALSEATLLRRIGHNWNYRLGFTDPFERFKSFINILKERNYQFFTCREIIEKMNVK